MKLYTRKGDQGDTSLLGGQRVAKDALRLEAYGTIDELNSVLGLAVVVCASGGLKERLLTIQQDLFVVGGELALPPREPAKPSSGPRIEAEDVKRLEEWIDEATEATPPLKNFILPGGTELSARLHLARTVCRRAERRIVAFSATEQVGGSVLPYVNRLGDLLFAWGRLANHEAGVGDIPWKPREGSASSG